MRFRAGLILLFFIALVAGGCRKPMAPTFDRNKAPETWISAAPMDTLFTRDASGHATPPQVLQISFRYHLYWAGSDPDGSISGFFYAVTETLPDPPNPEIDPNPPPLPGPKARDYHFTARTDSTFVFSVSDGHSDRQHAFYIYAVDNLGKPDPTPARFIFRAFDRFPPLAVIDQFLATGYVFTQDPNTLALTRSLQQFQVGSTDTFAIGRVPTAVVPSGARLDIHWHSEVTTASNPAVGYKYKMDEPQFVSVDSSVTSLTYNSGVADRVGPGLKIFYLRGVDGSSGSRQTSREFQMNFPPDSWFAGADTSWVGWTRSAGDRSVDVTIWPSNSNPGGSFADLRPAHCYLSADSLKVLPSQRKPYKSFLEFYGNKIYCVREFETVRMNSWLLFFNGGFDADSPYSVVWTGNDPNAPPSDTLLNPVIQIRPPNGSPIGFRSRVPASLTSVPPTDQAGTQTGLYPIYDPANVFRSPNIGAYWSFNRAGTYYFFARAQDGDGTVDNRIGSTPDLTAQNIVAAVDGGGGTPQQIALRKQIMVFNVDFPPYFAFTAAMRPHPGDVYFTRILTLNLVGSDLDPFDPEGGGSGSPPAPGGPPASAVYRYSASFRGPRNVTSPTDSVTFAPASCFRVANLPVSVTLPDSLGGTQIRVMVELCDCADCEDRPGAGRCSNYSYLVTVPAPPPPPPAPSASSSWIPSAPGTAAEVLRRRGER